ncbi:MAG: hypothetical protein H0V67_02580 [Geodermatophilaceae bacterium]|nr:hypothetical protein [Geodermatophilaceae bacterium]
MAALPPVARKFNYNLFKRFQFNPPTAHYTLQAVGINSPDEENPEGNFGGGAGYGPVSSGLELQFNRELEVMRATSGVTGGGVNATPPEFASMGVQLDVLDIYKCLLGEDRATQIAEGGTVGTVGSSFANMLNPGSAEVSAASLANLHGIQFDAAMAGRDVIISAPIGIVYSNNLAVYGWVSGFEYAFLKFNKNLVPTMVNVTISLDLMNISDYTTVVNSGAISQPASSATTTPTTVPSTTNTAPATTETRNPISPFNPTGR